MSVEIPKDLITQLQISLRKQANLSAYDPNASSLPALASFTNSTTGASHGGCCCLHCNARLLRGPDSLLCVFCGKRQTNSETPPHPIQFNSTSGYRWLLNSLNLDGSEIVGESLDGNERNKEPGKEFPLSDLLDLEIRWNDSESEEFESGFRKNNPLKLAGLEIDDDFLAERKGDSVSVPSEETLSAKKGSSSTGSNLFESRGFENFQGSTTSGFVSGWQADFQPADSKTDDGAISSMSFDPFVGSSKEKGNQAFSESKTNDLFQYDMKSISTSGDRVRVGASDAPGRKPTDDDDDDDGDFFGAWNDFKGSTNAPYAAQSSSDQAVDGLKSVEEKGGEYFSGLGAGSDSSVNETCNEVSKSFDQFAGSTADLSTHMDSVFGTGKESFQGKAVDNTTSSHTTNWFQDDLWSNSISGTLHAERSVGNVDDKDYGMLGNPNKSSVSINRIHDDQWPLSTNKGSDNGTNDEDDDSFGAWNDFTSSSILNSSISSLKEPAIHASSTEEKSTSDPFSGWDTDFQSANSKNNNEGSKSSDLFVGSSFDLSDHVNKVFPSGKDLFDGKAKDDSSNANSWFQDDLWGNSTVKLTRETENFDATVNVMDSGKAQIVRDSPSMVVELFPDDQWLTGNNKAPDKKTVDESDNSFDYWSDFKSSTTKQDAFSNSWKQADGPGIQAIDDNNSAWSDFTSSTSAKAPSSVSFEQPAHHEKPSMKTSEVHLFSMNSVSSDNDFGSSSQNDFFSGAFSNQNGSTEISIMPPKAPLSDRMGDANIRGGDNAEVAKDGDFPGATTGSKTDDIDILLSQMHDLSFMLESNLSIPPKVDDCN